MLRFAAFGGGLVYGSVKLGYLKVRPPLRRFSLLALDSSSLHACFGALALLFRLQNSPSLI